MEFLTELWLPIVLSTVIVFIASAVLWMALPLHKAEFNKPPNEDAVLDLVREQGLEPGQYFLPYCQDMGSHKDPAFLEKWKRGPWLMMTVMHQAPNFGKSLITWFIYQLVLCAIIAYAAAASLGFAQDHEYLKVFQVVGVIALLGQAGMCIQDTIWKGSAWRPSITKLVDGVVYALLIAGVFAWLWPSGAPLPG